jgi:hypothetical protein
MELKVLEKSSATEAVVEVVRGGPLRAHKVCDDFILISPNT